MTIADFVLISVGSGEGGRSRFGDSCGGAGGEVYGHVGGRTVPTVHAAELHHQHRGQLSPHLNPPPHTRTRSTDGTIVISSIALVRNGQLMEGTLVGVGRAATATGAATGGGNAPLYVTVNEDRLMWLHEKQRELTAVVAATKASADYQVGRWDEAYRG
eukprot:364363-Chlamydomonas_euryale.AAC.6